MAIRKIVGRYHVDFEKLAEESDWSLEIMEKKIEELAKKLPQTTGITYGSGKLWYDWNNWVRKHRE